MMPTILKMYKWNQYFWDKVSTSQAIYFEPKNERDHTCSVALKVHSRLGGEHDTP